MSAGTRERILEAAEDLFAERGIAATSLRALTRAADANLAAVHYHFGSKESLLDAVLERHAVPANAERLAELDRLEANGRTASVEEVLTAFVVPGLKSIRALSRRPELLGQLKARVEAQPADVVEALFRKHFGPVCARFLEATQRALPALGEELVDERFRFALGTLSAAFSGTLDLDTIPGHPPKPTEADARVHRLIEFLAAALRADETPCPRPARCATNNTNNEAPTDGERP